MSKLGRLQGTPWHVGALSREEGDPRRHRSYCVNYDKAQKFCTVKNMRCMGATHCDEYVDSTNCIENVDEALYTKSNENIKGRKLLSIADIYPGKFVLQKIEQSEFEAEKQYYIKHGCFSGSVVIKLCVSKYYIEDGYLYFYTAKKMGHKSISCIVRH